MRRRSRGEIDATRIWDRGPDRDPHLRSADFLDADYHPRIAFGGRFVERTGDTTFKAEVDLTLRGVTRPVMLDVAYLGQWPTPFWVGEENRAGQEVPREVQAAAPRGARGANGSPHML